MGLYSGGPIIGKIFVSRIWWGVGGGGVIFRRAYFRGSLLSGFYICASVLWIMKTDSNHLALMVYYCAGKGEVTASTV